MPQTPSAESSITGMSFPAARSSALIRYMREKATSVHNTFGVSSEHIELILSSPNNILGINTAKRFSVLTAVSFLITFKKWKWLYDTDFSLLFDEEFPSASGIRSLMKKSLKELCSLADLSRVHPFSSLPRIPGFSQKRSMAF